MLIFDFWGCVYLLDVWFWICVPESPRVPMCCLRNFWGSHREAGLWVLCKVKTMKVLVIQLCLTLFDPWLLLQMALKYAKRELYRKFQVNWTMNFNYIGPFLVVNEQVPKYRGFLQGILDDCLLYSWTLAGCSALKCGDHRLPALILSCHPPDSAPTFSSATSFSLSLSFLDVLL